jgi:hypothetical protein
VPTFSTEYRSVGSGIEIVTITGARTGKFISGGVFFPPPTPEGVNPVDKDKIYVIGCRYLGSKLGFRPRNLGNVVYETDLKTGEVGDGVAEAALALARRIEDGGEVVGTIFLSSSVTSEDVNQIYNDYKLKIVPIMEWLRANPDALYGIPSQAPSISANGTKAPGAPETLGVITRPTSSLWFDILAATVLGQSSAPDAPTTPSASGEPNPSRYLPDPSLPPRAAQGKAAARGAQVIARGVNEWQNGLSAVTFRTQQVDGRNYFWLMDQGKSLTPGHAETVLSRWVGYNLQHQVAAGFIGDE